MNHEAKIYELDRYRTKSEEPVKPSKTQKLLSIIYAVPVAIGVGLSLVALALVPIVASIFIGGLIAVVAVLGVIATLIALLIDQAKQKKRVQ